MKHNTYFDGNVQSLGFTAHGADYTVGVIEPGEYEFDASRFEKVQVVFGDLVDLRDGKHYCGQTSWGATTLPQFKPGEKVRLSCEAPVVYLCRYSDTPFPD